MAAAATVLRRLATVSPSTLAEGEAAGGGGGEGGKHLVRQKLACQKLGFQNLVKAGGTLQKPYRNPHKLFCFLSDPRFSPPVTKLSSEACFHKSCFLHNLELHNINILPFTSAQHKKQDGGLFVGGRGGGKEDGGYSSRWYSSTVHQQAIEGTAVQQYIPSHP